MKIRALKYLTTYTLPLAVIFSFTSEGWHTFMPIIYAFGIIPLLELFIKPDARNLSEAEIELSKSDSMYDLLVWFIVPVQVGFLVWYFFNINTVTAFGLTWWGRTVSMGLMCGVLGINVAHELGHRTTKFEQFFAKILLMTSLYPHFFIEHNYGHHKHVATADDPASARYNESLYVFWIRSIWGSYWHAWKIEGERLKRHKTPFFSLKNEMLRFTVYEVFFLVSIYIIFDQEVLFGFLVAALSGILLLETVNYIEHYGLSRKKITTIRYENTTPSHSWNSNHILGRVFLFELSRHSDHHAYPHKKYQLLQTYSHSPQMPTGYPGMMLLSAIPPLWFWIMNTRLENHQLNQKKGDHEAALSVN
jgi:alkane 1-monooxygenase